MNIKFFKYNIFYVDDKIFSGYLLSYSCSYKRDYKDVASPLKMREKRARIFIINSLFI